MKIEQEQKKLLEEMTTKDYFTFETDESYQITVKDWKVENKLVPDYHDATIKTEKSELSCTFILSDGLEKEFSTLSKRFAEKISPFIIDMVDPITLVITKVGDKQAVNYLIKEVKG